MTVRELVAKFGLSLDRSSFDRADQRVEKLKTAAMAVGAAFAGSKVIGWARQMVDETARAGATLDTLAQRTGISVEGLQEFRHAGEMAGLSVNDIDASLQRFNRRLGSAASGNKSMASAFSALGLRIRDGSGAVKDADTLFMEMADAMAKLPSDAHRSAHAMNLMGDAGLRMAPLFRDGAAGIEAWRTEARELGVMSGDAAKEAAEMANQQIRLRRAMSGLRDQIVGRLLPAMNETVPKVLAWMRANRELIAQRVEQAVKAITAAMVILNNVATAIVEVVRRVRDAMGETAAAGFKLLLIVTALVALFGLKAVAIGLLVAVVEDFIGFLQGKDSIIGRIVDWMRELREEFLSRDLSWQEHPYLKFLQEVLRLWDKLSDKYQNLPKPLKWALAAAGPIGAITTLAQTPKTFEGIQRNNRAPRDLEAQEEHMAQVRRDLGLPAYVEPSPSATAGRMTNAEVHQSVQITIEGSRLSGEEVRARVEEALGNANRRAFAAAVPAPAGG